MQKVKRIILLTFTNFWRGRAAPTIIARYSKECQFLFRLITHKSLVSYSETVLDNCPNIL